jgi:hypothetical protein
MTSTAAPLISDASTHRRKPGRPHAFRSASGTVVPRTSDGLSVLLPRPATAVARNTMAAMAASTRIVSRQPMPSTSAAVKGRKIGLANAPRIVNHTTARSGAPGATRIAAG